MKGIGIGPTGGRVLSRMQGTKGQDGRRFPLLAAD